MLDIDNEDEPVKRIMRPPFPAKFLNDIDKKQTVFGAKSNKPKDR